jgi:hypothetical protein
MKGKIVAISIVVLALLSSAGSGEAGVVAMGDAEIIAENWISLIIFQEGSWGGADEAEICSVEPFARDGRLLGYICHIRPQGHIVVSLLEGLAPVKAYSATSSLTPALEEGLPDLIKLKMGRLLDEVEKRLGPLEDVTTEALQQVIESDMSEGWAFLSQDPELVRRQLTSGEVPLSYTAGEILLSSNWHQGDPYYQNCPAGTNGCTADHCAVGCVATAAAQIMDYWNWPPFTPSHAYRYDWANMPDTLTVGSPQAQIDATALLCREIGDQVGMNYCSGDDNPCASGAQAVVMVAQYPDFDFSSSATLLARRDMDDQDEWWNEIKIQIDNEQPAQYFYTGHSIVLDGYRVTFNNRWYHMNYGWAGNCGFSCCAGLPNTNTWYEVDQMLCSDDYANEYMIVNIFPVHRLRGSLAGRYDPPLLWPPYRYLSDDSYTANGADFWGGQYLQLQKSSVAVTCPESATAALRFYGDPDSPNGSLYFFKKGDHTRGFRVDDGAMAIYAGGGLLLH